MSEDPKKPVSESLRDWGIDVERFNERAKESLQTARGDLTEITGTLRQTLLQAKEVLVGMQSAGSPAASELKQGFERAWQEIESAFKAARQKARDGEPAAAAPAEPVAVASEPAASPAEPAEPTPGKQNGEE